MKLGGSSFALRFICGSVAGVMFISFDALDAIFHNRIEVDQAVGGAIYVLTVFLRLLTLFACALDFLLKKHCKPSPVSSFYE